MSGEDRRLAALAAALFPDRARPFLARAAAPSAADEGARLAALPRRDRLAALAAALTAGAAPARAALAIAAEREPVAHVLRGLAAGAPPAGIAPALLRICRERLA